MPGTQEPLLIGSNSMILTIEELSDALFSISQVIKALKQNRVWAKFFDEWLHGEEYLGFVSLYINLDDAHLL